LRSRIARVGSLVTLVISIVFVGGIGMAPAEAETLGAEIVVVGGSAVVPDKLATHLETCTNGALTRVAGTNRYETAAEISRDWASADTVILATGSNYPDALGAGPVAVLNNAPILLTARDTVPGPTAAALERLAPNRIILLGGTAVISTAIENALKSQYPEVLRLAGTQRYETAAAVSAWQFTAGAATAYITTGENYPDAVVAGSRAASEGAPLLLVNRNSLPPSTAAELQRLHPDRIVIVGSATVVAEAVEAELAHYAPGGVTRIAGASRHSTAAAVAAGMSGSRTFIVTGTDFPDGLAATPATHGAPILFVSNASMTAATADAVSHRTGVACGPWTAPPPPYPQVGSGKRIIYSNSAQRVWLVNQDGSLHDTYLVSGRVGIPHYATYRVFSKSVNAWAPYGGITMKYMVRFVHPHTWGNQWSYGFHAIPHYANGQPMQTEAQLGTRRSGGCVRQSDAKALGLYQWAPIGTPVHAIP